MDKKVVKRIGIILGLFVLVIVLAIGCNMITSEDDDPQVSDPDRAFLEFSGITITRQSLYQRAKTLEGISHLLNYVDEKLLEDYIDDVTLEDIQEELLRIKYGTTDQAIIDEFTEEQLERYEQNFYYTIVYSGFNPERPEEVERFVSLNLAKQHATRNELLKDFEEDTAIDLDAQVQKHYEEIYRGDITAIELIFHSQQEYEATLLHFNLVADFEGGIGLYRGATPLEDMSREDLTLANTDVMPEDLVFDYFIKMYNYLYQYREQLDENLTMEDTFAFGDDYFQFNYKEMKDAPRTQRVTPILFTELAIPDPEDEDDESLRYTVEARRYNTQMQRYEHNYVMYFKIDQAEPVAFDDLDQARHEEVTNEYLDRLVTTELVVAFMVELRNRENFTLHDRHLKLSYEQMIGSMVGSDSIRYKEGDGTVVASLDSFDITVDEYFEYMVRRIGAMVAVEMYLEEYLLQSDYFEIKYGTNRNLIKSNDPRVKEVRDLIDNLAYQFGASPYANSYTWDEFIYLFYGFTSDEDFLRRMAISELNKFLLTPNMDFEKAHEFVEKHHDNYLNVRAEHLLVYIDFDGDLDPDDFLEWRDGLSTEDYDEYYALRVQLETMLIDAVNDGSTMREVANMFNRASRNEDDNDWAQFKNFGFKVRYENLSGDGTAINYLSVQNYVDEFKDNLYRIYDRYTGSEYIEDASMLDDRIFATEFGMHLVNVRKGTNAAIFEVPSAAFEDTDNEFDDARWENPSSVPSIDQLTAWSEREIDRLENGGQTSIPVPADVDLAIRTLYSPYFNGLLPSSDEFFDPFGYVTMIDLMIENNVEFEMEDEHLQVMIRALREVYEMMLYPNN